MELAQRILELAAAGRVTLNTGGTTSNNENRRSVFANIEDTANGIGAMTPFPQLGGGTGRVELDPYMLSAIIYMVENMSGTFEITTIAGATHSRYHNAHHPTYDEHAAGYAVDFNSSGFIINGYGHTAVLDRLRAAGFVVNIYWGGYHGNEVHFHLSVHNGH